MIHLILILTVIGSYFLVNLFEKNKKWLKLLISFSGAYLLATTLLHLVPNLYNHDSNETSTKILGAMMLLGIVTQYGLESISKGAEHGHVHKNGNNPWLVIIGLSIHAFFEGFPLNQHGSSHLVSAIIIHKIPIAIVLCTFLKQTRKSNLFVFVILFIFSLLTPAGNLISDLKFIEKDVLIYLSAFTTGIFLHVSTIILFESSENHRFNLKKFSVIVAGILFAIFL